MVKKGFPKFGMSQAGAYVTALKNYNLPDFILKLVAKDTDSELLDRGRIDDRLQSMNDQALELLNRVFVECNCHVHPIAFNCNWNFMIFSRFSRNSLINQNFTFMIHT